MGYERVLWRTALPSLELAVVTYWHDHDGPETACMSAYMRECVGHAPLWIKQTLVVRARLVAERLLRLEMDPKSGLYRPAWRTAHHSLTPVDVLEERHRLLAWALETLTAGQDPLARAREIALGWDVDGTTRTQEGTGKSHV